MAYISGQVLKNGNPISGAKVTLIKQFNIKNIADIALWLKADTGVIKDASGNVSEWQDQSGNNNHATQTDPTHQPVLLDNRYNGKPAIYFDGNNKYLQLPGDFFRNIPAVDIFVVVSHAVPLPGAHQTYIIGTFIGTEARVQFRSNETSYLNLVIGGQRLDSGSWYGMPSNNTNKAQQRYIHNGVIDFVNGRLAIYFDQLFDTENTSFPGGGNTDDTDSINTIGIRKDDLGNLDRPLFGYLYEMLIFYRVLSDDERQNIYDYLNLKYNCAKTENHDSATIVDMQFTDANGNYQFNNLENNSQYHVFVEYEDQEGQYHCESYPFITPVV